MKKLLLGTVALVALSMGGTSAMAADMPVYKAPLPVWTWAGVYFGAHAGGGWGRTDWRTNEFTGLGGSGDEFIRHDPGGWVLGGQLGARWQWGAWVVGVEGSLAASRIRDNTTVINTATGAVIPGSSADTLHGTLATVTGQVGYAWNRTLWYVKGGWAGSETRLRADLLGPAACGPCAGITRLWTGYTAGAGIEYLVLQNLSLGIEYDYFRLRTGNTNNQASDGFPVVWLDQSARIHQVVARANYRLDWGVLWGGPVAARY